MENHNHSAPEMVIINFILTVVTGTLGYISVNYQESLKDIDTLLSPAVKVCSILSFILFIILNYEDLKKKFKNFRKKR